MTGPPEDDPKGRWQRGGGKNVPVKVTLKLEESKLGRLSGNWNPVDLLLEHERLHEEDD